MHIFPNNVHLVERVDELPWNLVGSERVFIDFETSSGDPQLDSLNPWHHCKLAGICICADNSHAYYIPVGHNGHDAHRNLPIEPVRVFLLALIENAKTWINHNIKYDAHVYCNELGVELPKHLVMICTLTLSKILDSDRGYGRGTYELESLSADWLREDTLHYKRRLTPYLKDGNGKYFNRDYGQIPVDLLGEYGGQDVLTVRKLYWYLRDHMPGECMGVCGTEVKLTTRLFEMERRGLCVNDTELKITQLQLMHRLDNIRNHIQDVTGQYIFPHVREDCEEILCGHYGMPVLHRNELTDKQREKGQEEGNASFAEDSLKDYLTQPGAPRQIIDLMLEYREKNTLNNLFVKQYQLLHINNILHPTFNQLVRTGRMSCRQPNAHQLSKAAKKLIHPPPGWSFISIDYAQIEFRLIIHYINNLNAIYAYQKNPDEDFHTWVASMCGIPRSPAKTCNFLMGYGGGKGKLIAKLASEKSLISELADRAQQMSGGDESKARQLFTYLCQQRGEEVYGLYHQALPELKPTSRQAAWALRSKGFIRNMYNRHRRLPLDRDYAAFNTANQSSAADMMKERTVAICDLLEGMPILPLCNVHDEILFMAPTEIANDERTQIGLVSFMEAVQDACPVPLRIPIRCSIGVSDKSWYHAGADDNTRTIPYELTSRRAHIDLNHIVAA